MRPRAFTARLGERTFEVRRGERLLEAARRQGVPFPSSCRVGGCGTCRCRLVEGRVRELTETAYLLSAEELARGTILACQSVPLGDVVVALDSAAGAARAALAAGGGITTAGLLAIVAFYVLGDVAFGEDRSVPRHRHPGLLTFQLWLALPLLGAIVLASLRSLPEAAGPGHLVSAWLLTGLMIGMVGTIPAHELTHRTWDPVSRLVGRWLLAFSLDTTFAIEHVYGHHRYVATAADPATAPRGRSVYRHVVVSTWKGNASAWRIEVARLAKRGRGAFGWRNAVLRGQLMSLALVAGAWAYGGWRAAAFFLACALWGKALLEIVNYMEHYGLVREPGAPVKPRHSWNTTRRLSSWTLFNLTRHSHHHAQGELPFHALRPLPGAPTMIAGYLTTIVLTLVPPVWRRLMAPRLSAWDREQANAAERRLLGLQGDGGGAFGNAT
ncbi:MAG: fatty acid desaturase [Anaeromyxobacteraceae bacterium]